MKRAQHMLIPKVRLLEILWLSLIPLLGVSSVARAQSQSKTRAEFEFLYQKQSSLAEFEAKFFKMEQIRQGAEESLNQLLKVRKNDLELQLRMAELHLQKARDLEHYSLELEFSGQSARAQEKKKEFKALSQKGLSLHEKLLRANSSHPLVSEILLGMARTRLTLGDKNGAFKDAVEGIRRFKGNNNKAHLNLWIVRGDAAFALHRSAEALQAFEQAKKLAEKSGEDSAYIVYKLAWTHFNMKDSEKAVSYLDTLLEDTQDKLSLRKEAVQDYALFVVDLESGELKKRGGVVGIYEYLKKVAGAEPAVRAFESLGKNYYKNGHRTLALEAYELILAQNPTDPKNFGRALLVVEWSQSLANKWELAEKYQWLLTNFGPKSGWFAAQNQKPDVQKNAYDRIEDSLRKFSMSLHQEATKEGTVEMRDKREAVVAQLYDAYLQAFSEESRLYYYRAEIYRRKKQWAEAGTHYDRFLTLFAQLPDEKKSKNDEKLRDEAAWGSVQVWAKAIDEDSKHVPSMLKSSDSFVENFKTHPMAAAVALDAAKVELKMKRSAVALRRIEELYKAFPKTTEASVGVHAALDILNQEKDYVNLAIKARLFLTNLTAWSLPSERDKIKGELTEILSKTEAKACESLAQTKGRALEAAFCFENFASDFKKDALAPKALLMASDLYTRENKNEMSLVSLEKLIKNYPESEQATEAFSKLALAYEKNFEFSKAAEVFEILLRKNDKVGEKAKIAGRLLVLLEGLGEEVKLEKILSESFINAAVKRDFFERRALRILAALERAQSLGAMDKGKFNQDSHQHWLTELEANGNLLPLEASLRLARVKGILLRSNNKLDQADGVWMAALKNYWKSSQKRDPRVLEAAARLRLEQATMWESMFRNTNFTKNGSRKTELYAKLENWYAEVVALKSPSVALEALLKSAKLSMDFSKELEVALERAPASDKATMTQVSADLKAKSDMLVDQVRQRAKAWRVLSPAVVEAVSLKDSSQSFKAVNLREHPWGPLTLFADLNEEQNDWEEWQRSESVLRSQMKNREARSASRRAAFVLLARAGSLNDADVGAWAQLHNDRAGIQMRVQALINDQKYRMAQIYIDQYRALIGEDAFVPYANGLLAWAEGNFEEAFRNWMTPGKTDDFRLAFLRLAWAQGMDQTKLPAKDYEVLSGLVKHAWQKHMLAKVCLDEFLECPAGETFYRALDTASEPPFGRDFAWSAFEYRRLAYYRSVERGVQNAKTMGELESSFARLNGYLNLKNVAGDARQADIRKDFSTLKGMVEKKSSELRQDKGRVLAGTQSTAVEGGRQ